MTGVMNVIAHVPYLFDGSQFRIRLSLSRARGMAESQDSTRLCRREVRPPLVERTARTGFGMNGAEEKGKGVVWTMRVPTLCMDLCNAISSGGVEAKVVNVGDAG